MLNTLFFINFSWLFQQYSYFLIQFPALGGVDPVQSLLMSPRGLKRISTASARTQYRGKVDAADGAPDVHVPCD